MMHQFYILALLAVMFNLASSCPATKQEESEVGPSQVGFTYRQIVLLGESGSGKSSLGQVIFGKGPNVKCYLGNGCFEGNT